MDYIKDEKHFKELCGYEIDGAWYPRVTKIVDIKSKPALYRYYGDAKSYKAAQETTEKSAAEGTLIHETVEKIFVGESPLVDPSIMPAVVALREFLDHNRIQVDPENVERRIVNYDHRYAGTIDTLALIDGKFGVLDIKTSQAIYRDYDLQTSAYMDALTREFKNLQTRWILRIDQQKSCMRCSSMMRPKGGREKIRKGRGSSCAVEEHEWGDLKGIIELKECPYWKQDFQAFLGAKKLWEWENEFWLKKVGYLSSSSF